MHSYLSRERMRDYDGAGRRITTIYPQTEPVKNIRILPFRAELIEILLHEGLGMNARAARYQAQNSLLKVRFRVVSVDSGRETTINRTIEFMPDHAPPVPVLIHDLIRDMATHEACECVRYGDNTFVYDPHPEQRDGNPGFRRNQPHDPPKDQP